MTAELYEGPMVLDNFCLLDHNYEELAAIYHYEPLRNDILNSGIEGELFIEDLEIFVKTNGEAIYDYEPAEEEDEEELEEQFTYHLPLEILDTISTYLDGLMTLASKQRYIN
jgi:hypothetical protein